MKCKIFRGMEIVEKEINEFLLTKIEASQIDQHYKNVKIKRTPDIHYIVPTGNAIVIFYT